MDVQVPDRPVFSRFFLIAAALITLLGMAWRLANLGGDGFWLDEMITVQGTRDLATAVENPHHLPLLPVLSYASIRLLGENEFSSETMQPEHAAP